MNEMRKLMEAVEGYLDDGGPYTAASLYLKAERGTTKPQLAEELNKLTAIDYDIAVLMIDAIDAYEDIRESFNESVAEDSTDIQYPDYSEYDDDLAGHLEAINDILASDPKYQWHLAAKVIKRIMDENDVIAGDLE